MYQRIMAWLAGPISIAAGYGAMLAVRYLGPLGGLLGKNAIAAAITQAVAFAVGAGCTALLHWKWFSNLEKWWAHFGFNPSVKQSAYQAGDIPRPVSAGSAKRPT